MSALGIHGHLLEVTVVGCMNLKDTEFISRQDPYVYLEYGSTKFRTRTCTDGGKTPIFQEKFTFLLIEGLRGMNVVVWNSNTLTCDDFIGNGKVQLQRVLSEGYDDSPWILQTKTGRFAGEVRLIMHYELAEKPGTAYAPSAPPYATPPPYQAPPYATPSPYQSPPYATPPQATSTYPPSSYPTPSPSPYPYPAYTSYPSSMYPPSQAAYPPPSAYHHPPPSGYPPLAYPPPSPYYPPGPFPGFYPPPSY